MIPNLCTLTALSCGLTGLRMGLVQRWQEAVLLVIFAGVLDGFDGRLARLLNASSAIGAELDSFSDLVNFGVVPAILIYLFSLHHLGNLGWIVCLFYIICMALRLSRFNVALDEPQDKKAEWQKSFFVGVPAPAGALVALMPMIFLFGFELSCFIHPVLNLVWISVSALLLVSTLPTLSLKKIYIPKKYLLATMLTIVFIVAAVITEPWLSLSIISFLYLCLIPYSFMLYKRKFKFHDEQP